MTKVGQMSTCYEFGFACDLKSGLSQEVIDTLKYMTRSEEYEFRTTLTDDLFISSWEEGSFEVDGSSDKFIYVAEWRTIITNMPSYGQEDLSGLCGAVLKDSKLNVRKFVGDDEFYNAFPQLMEWLVSICDSTGFVGYYSYIRNMYIGSDPILIYFKNGQVMEKKVTSEFKELLTSD
jgi:hypothetical protein